MARQILTVLRSCGEYRPEHVERLRDQCAAHSDAEFRCLSDMVVPGRIELKHNWPGWWSKIEMFRLPGPWLYMDLDTTVLGDLAPLLDAVGRHEFIALRDFNPHLREMGSGLMAWRGDASHIYRKFREEPAWHMTRCKTRRWFGDQGFIEPLTEGRAHWQDILPGTVVSWKKHCKEGIPKGARVVCFHGKPRPWEV